MRKQTEIVFIRHGETEFNKANLYFGHLDPELNATGRTQLLNTKETLRKIEKDIDEVFCSPLKRCIESMEILELEKQKSESELAALKAQLNPHFRYIALDCVGQ